MSTSLRGLSGALVFLLPVLLLAGPLLGLPYSGDLHEVDQEMIDVSASRFLSLNLVPELGTLIWGVQFGGAVKKVASRQFSL